MRTAFIAGIACLLAADPALSQDEEGLPSPAGVSTGVFFPGERLQYKVKWLFFRLGTIVVTTESLPEYPDGSRIKVRVDLDSNPELFFISINNRYESIVGTFPVRCLEFRGYERQGSDTLVTHYRMNDSLQQIEISQWRNPGQRGLMSTTIDSVDRFFDGASLLYFARTMIHTPARVSAPTIIDTALFFTDIDVTEPLQPMELERLERNIDVRTLSGRANFVGKTFAGFSGDFRGWFSSDPTAIPVRAEMHITLGTAVVALESWYRPDWQLPFHRGKP